MHSKCVATNEDTKVGISAFVSEDLAIVGLLNATIVQCMNEYETHVNRCI